MWALVHCLEALFVVFQKSQNGIFGEFFWPFSLKTAGFSFGSSKPLAVRCAISPSCLLATFFRRFSKISKWDFWRIFLWKSHESLVCILVTSRVYFYIGYIWLVFCWENPLIPPLVVSRSERVYIYGPSLSNIYYILVLLRCIWYAGGK